MHPSPPRRPDRPDAAGRALRRSLRRGALLVAAAVLVSCQPQEQAPAPRPKARQSSEHLVELAPVVADSLRTTSVYTGSLQHRRRVRIFTQEEGRITRLPYYEGDAVAAGAVLVELDDRLLKAELAKAQASARQAKLNLERANRLRDQRMVSDEEFLRAQTILDIAEAETTVLQTRLGYTRIQAPFAGVIAQRLADPGDIVEQHSHILTLVDPNSLVTDLAVSELLIPHLGLGAPVEVRIDALGDRRYSGRVLRIHPELDPRTRQGRVEIEIDPVPAGARAGQFARVRFEVTLPDRNTLPFSALRRDRDSEFVFRVDEQGRAKRRAVRSGRRLADRVEILEGLSRDDRVVSRGFLGLKDGTRVTAVDAAEGVEGVEGATAEGPR